MKFTNSENIQACESWVKEAARRKDTGQQEHSDHRYLFDLFLQANPGKGYAVKTIEGLVDEAFLFIGAGTDTSGFTLAAATHYILRNPRVLTKLRQELEEANLYIKKTLIGSESKSYPIWYFRRVYDTTLFFSSNSKLFRQQLSRKPCACIPSSLAVSRELCLHKGSLWGHTFCLAVLVRCKSRFFGLALTLADYRFGKPLCNAYELESFS
jgi:hypothetical protein